MLKSKHSIGLSLFNVVMVSFHCFKYASEVFYRLNLNNVF